MNRLGTTLLGLKSTDAFFKIDTEITNHQIRLRWQNENFIKHDVKGMRTLEFLNSTQPDRKGKEIKVPEDEGGGSLTQVRGTVVTRRGGRNQHNGQGS